jgi:nitroimidazol reductase NimA-like FMN-containing flavoprotein (pyridoxamine 5'-phosphate oxidase superfamily)
MIHEGFDPNFTKIRRSQQAITDERWIKEFLKRAPVGVLATVFQDQPFLSTKLFVYDEIAHQIYLHAADEGRVLENIQLNPKVCFTTYTMGRFLPAPRARSFGVEYESVVVFGKLELIEVITEKISILKLVMEKYAPHLKPERDYPEIEEAELKGVAVYRLNISGWSAKLAHEEPDHPGAYDYEEIIGK